MLVSTRAAECAFTASGVRPAYPVGMTPEETAPPFETWAARLKDLGDRELAKLVEDYRWLDEEARAQEEREDFHRRREAILNECRRRGMNIPEQARRA